MNTQQARTRLDEAKNAYTLALDIADELDRNNMDLWGGVVRSCLQADSSTYRQMHLIAELTRLHAMHDIEQVRLRSAIAEALQHLQHGVGQRRGSVIPQQPVYSALRNLADHLEFHGAQRWLARLRTVAADTSRVPQAIVERLRVVMAAMTPDAAGVPSNSAECIAAVTHRLNRTTYTLEDVLFIRFALQPPMPSRIHDAPSPRSVADAPDVMTSSDPL